MQINTHVLHFIFDDPFNNHYDGASDKGQAIILFSADHVSSLHDPTTCRTDYFNRNMNYFQHSLLYHFTENSFTGCSALHRTPLELVTNRKLYNEGLFLKFVFDLLKIPQITKHVFFFDYFSG